MGLMSFFKEAGEKLFGKDDTPAAAAAAPAADPAAAQARMAEANERAAAGVGIAFHAKPVVRYQAHVALTYSGLDGVINLFAD